MLLTWADDVLRAKDGILSTGSTRRGLVYLGMIVCVFGMIYGGVMGSYAGILGERFLQVVYSAVKVPLLLMVTAGLNLPFFYVVNSLYGLREDMGIVMRALLATQASVTIVLAALSPLTIVWYLSFENYRAAILFNAVMFATASISSQLVMRQYYKPLIARNPMHGRLLKLWITIYGFVGIQMGWTLRPFIGNPNSPTQFFRDEAWGNAYLQLYHIIMNVFNG